MERNRKSVRQWSRGTDSVNKSPSITHHLRAARTKTLIVRFCQPDSNLDIPGRVETKLKNCLHHAGL